MTTPTSLSDELINLVVRSRTTNGRPLPAEETARAEAVYRAIHARFDADPSPEYRAMLADFERRPTRHQESLRRSLDDVMGRDPAFAARLERMARPRPVEPQQQFHAPIDQLTTIDHAVTVIISPTSGRGTSSGRATSSGPPPLPPPLATLCDRLIAAFSRDELMDLALALGLLPESIPDDTIQAYARGLILACWRDGQLEQLLAGAARLRPRGDWRLDLPALPDTLPAEFDDVPAVRQTTIINRAGTVKNIRSVFSDARQVALVLAVALGVAALVYGAYWYSRQPERMDGEFNVAVAQIELAADEADSYYAPILTQQIASILGRELGALGPGVQVSDHNMGVVHDAGDAGRLAGRANAHIVVYGEAEVLNDTVRFTPHFYVNDTVHPAMFELNGSGFLEEAVVMPTEALAKEPPDTAKIAARAALLTDFVRALVYLAFDDLPAAAAQIDSAVHRVETDDRLAGLSGYEVVYLYASHIARMEGPAHWNDAETYAGKALAASDRPYARAYVARGNIAYDQDDYAAAYDAYLAALALPSEPRDLIAAKASLGLGNVALGSLIPIRDPDCGGEEQARVAEGLARFQAVIDARTAADAPDARLNDLAGWAWIGIGKIRYLCGSRPAAAEAWRTALGLPLTAAPKDEANKLLASLEE